MTINNYLTKLSCQSCGATFFLLKEEASKQDPPLCHSCKELEDLDPDLRADLMSVVRDYKGGKVTGNYLVEDDEEDDEDDQEVNPNERKEKN